jgi:hypothetical protein
MNAAHDTQDDEILWYSNVKEARQCVSPRLRTSQVSDDANAFSGANIAQRFHVFIVTIFDYFFFSAPKSTGFQNRP